MEKFKVNQLHQIGMNLIFLPLKMSHPIHLHQQHHLGLLAVHPHLQAATVLLIVILHILHLNDEHQFILILFIMKETLQKRKQVSTNFQNGQFNF